MTQTKLADLQDAVQIPQKLTSLQDYYHTCQSFLNLISELTRIVSPTKNHYIFYQYSQAENFQITRPINTKLFIEIAQEFDVAWQQFLQFLIDLRQHQEQITCLPSAVTYLKTSPINRIVYTIQQAIGCIGDSLPNSNQARKRAGQLFELLVKLILQEIGLVCESRTVHIPVPHYPDIQISYELDLVFSRYHTIVAAETRFINPNEIIGSIKTTSKDRIDKIFLDKYLLTKLLGRNIPVVAIFLHDVQRARIRNNDFGVNSTFKSNHFLGYTIALNQLDGVYYVDSETVLNDRLRPYISDFQSFLTKDLWRLSK
ncbi:hypothetical protein A6A03_02470 [Chloroflexus islandicus]|uniref:Uncharacterized protein n=1 Tax=Chloroflexus islandicus TaxID=1707952 RepID=A0A178MAH6_9CHLR|nr:hypothetical protein [Chloroflexus islandicus]OAN45038.1 hypothetical protein A6A03_02470 [Chloroflexus islandicus]